MRWRYTTSCQNDRSAEVELSKNFLAYSRHGRQQSQVWKHPEPVATTGLPLQHPMLPPSLASAYCSWLISLFLETMLVSLLFLCIAILNDSSLYGIGILQIFLSFQWQPAYNWSIKGPVSHLSIFLSFEPHLQESRFQQDRGTRSQIC
jgi:hypothetical protein